MKRLMIFVVSVFALIFSACSSQSETTNVDYPTSVKNGKISEEFYDEFSRLYAHVDDINNAHDIIYESELQNPEIILEKDYVNIVFASSAAVEHVLSDDTHLKAKNSDEEELLKNIKTAIAAQQVYSKKLKEKTSNAYTDDEAMMLISRGIKDNTFKKLQEIAEEYGIELRLEEDKQS